jgi:hypothetical protein
MAEGIANVRKAHGERGYINYTGVPDTKFDDDNKIINIESTLARESSSR